MKKRKGGASFDRRHVRPKHVVMGRAVQAQETRAGQRRSAAQESRDASLGFDLRRRARLSANVLVDHRTARTTPAAARRARAAQSDEERMLAQWHRERQRSRKFSLGEEDDGNGSTFGAGGLGGARDEDEEEGEGETVALTHGGRVLGAREEDYHEVPEGRESDAEEDVLGHDAEDLSALYERGGASVVERARERRAERQRERAERQRLAASLDDQFDAVAALVLEHKSVRPTRTAPRSLLPDGQDGSGDKDEDVVPTLFTETAGEEDEDGKDGKDGNKEKDNKSKSKQQQQQLQKQKKGKGKGKKGGDDDDDDFEALVHALGSEAKGRATDRTKRPEELAAERVAQLEALEAERVRRQAQTALSRSGAGGGDDDDGVFGGGGDDDDEDEDEDEDGGLGLAEMRRLLREQNRASAEADDMDFSELQQKGEGEKQQQEGDKTSTLPFTFGVPETVAEWTQMSAEWGARERELVVRRILACNHPALAPDNAARLTALMGVLLDSVGAAPGPVAPAAAASVARSVGFLARELGGEAAARAFAPRLRACYAATVAARTAPAPGTLCVLTIAEDVFPVSDFRHVVATPLALLLAALLSRHTLQIQSACGCGASCGGATANTATANNKEEEEKHQWLGDDDGGDNNSDNSSKNKKGKEEREAVATGLYVCTLLLRFATENARYIPEVLAYLDALLHALAARAPVPQGPCVPLALPWSPAGVECTALAAPAWTARATATALRLLGVAARAWATAVPDCALVLRPLAQHVEQHIIPRLAECSGGVELAQQTVALCGAADGKQQTKKDGQEQEQRTFRTVERRNVVPLRELAPRIAEASLDQRQVEQERLRRLKRTLARERKALGREVKKDAAYTMRVLEQESAEENRAIRAAHGRILNMLQDEQHEQKVEQRQKEREKRRLRM